MDKKPTFMSRGMVVFSTLVVLAGLSASRANAAAVYIWVANGSALTGYSNTGVAVSGASVTVPTGGNYFAVTSYGTSSSNEYVAVSDSANHTLTEYLWNGTSLASQIGTATFNFPADPAGGAISPQEIAIDPSGNLWTTSAGGKVSEYCGNSSGCIVNSVHYSAGAVIQTVTVPTSDGAPRGIMIDTHTATTTVYVTTSSYGKLTDNVYDFTIGSNGLAGSLTGYAALTASTTSGGDETGQLRGITYDPGGNIFFADSTWGASADHQGYVLENTGTATALTALAGPNALEVGNGTKTGALSSSCDVMFVASYYSGNLGESNTGYNASGALDPTNCGSSVFGTSSVFISGLTNISGIALSVGEGGLGDDAVGPTGLFLTNTSAVPEPGTFPLMTGALLLALGIGTRVQRRRLHQTGRIGHWQALH